MYVRITGARIQLFDNNGNPAAGYEIHTYSAGTTTDAYSYSDRLLTVANTNPVVLDARGEADLYTGVPLKLVFTIPGGDPTSPIWEEDWIGEQQSNNLTGEAEVGTVDNSYVVNPTPAITALSNNLQLIMTPDVDNLDTINPYSVDIFTGSGSNDLTPSGPYLGSAGATFTIKIDTAVEEDPAALTAALSAVGGAVTAGAHYVKVTHITFEGETTPGAASAVVNADGSHKIACTAIPLGSEQVIGRNIYMTKAAGAITSPYYLVSHSGADTGPVAIAGLSRAGACVVTWNGHGLSTNDVVVFAGITQPGWTALNSYTGVITWIDANSFSIAVDTSGYADPYDAGTDPGIYVCPTIPNNTTVAFDINTADAALTVLAPTAGTSGGSADTFTWKKGGGAWHPKNTISTLAQSLMEGFYVTFATSTGHVCGDIWAVPVVPAARVNLNGLGALLVYKNKNSSLVAIDGGDMKAGYPAVLVLDQLASTWLLINPATPVFSTTTISAIRYRKDISGDYTLLLGDQGRELNCKDALTLTLLPAPSFSNRFVYIKNTSTKTVVVDAGERSAGVPYLIYGPNAGSRYLNVPPGACYQLETNGVDWHVITSIGTILLEVLDASSETSVTLGTALYPGVSYRIVMDIVLSAGSNVAYIQFNGDAGHHRAIAAMTDEDGTVSLEYSTAYAPLGDGITTTGVQASVDFGTIYGDDTQVKACGMSHFIDAVTKYTGAIITAFYDGTSDLSSIVVGADGGATFSGRIWLYQIG
jgi:hypothetical protein